MKSTLLPKLILPIVIAGCSNENSSSNTIPPDSLPDYLLSVFSDPTNVNNIYFGPANTGQTYVYEGGEVGEEPEEEIRIELRTTSKEILGIICLIQNDRAYLNGVLIEDTDDWLAQDDTGNVWYFGEFVKNYKEGSGNFANNNGSWEAGADGALPGFWIPADPVVGMKYHQEFYSGEAEDQAEVIAVGETVTIGFGTFTNCIVTRDFTRFESGIYELKYYAPSVGLIMEEGYEDNVLVEIVELVAIIDNP